MPRLFDDVRVFGDARVDVRERGRGEFELVQAEIEAAVGHDSVRMRPGVGGAALAEPEALVVSHRFGNVGRLDADFVKLS